MPGDADERIERELSALVRQALGLHLTVERGGVERAAYAILARLHDDGPLRLSAIAALMGRDTSTVSRQVGALHEAGLVQRSMDPADRRAALIGLTGRGRSCLLAQRAERRRELDRLLGPWSPEDRERFAALLERFNAGLAEDAGTRHAPGTTPAGEPAPDGGSGRDLVSGG